MSQDQQPGNVVSEEQRERNRAEHAAIAAARDAAKPSASQERGNAAGCWLFAAVAITAVFVLLYVLGGNYLRNRAEAKSQQAAAAARALTLEGQAPEVMREACINSVSSKLKSPTSARFPDSVLPTYGGGQWNWVSYVEAQNAFGMQIKTNFLCAVAGSTPQDAKVSTTLAE